MFSVKFQGHYLILLLPPCKLLKEEKNGIILFFEWIKTSPKILELKDPLQTAGARTCLPDTNCLIPWFPPPHWLKSIAFLLKESCLCLPQWVMFGSLQLLQVPQYSSAAHSHLSQSFHWVYLVVSYLPPPTRTLKINFHSEILHFFTEIICFHLTVLVPNIKREILHQVQKVLFKAQT